MNPSSLWISSDAAESAATKPGRDTAHKLLHSFQFFITGDHLYSLLSHCYQPLLFPLSQSCSVSYSQEDCVGKFWGN